MKIIAKMMVAAILLSGLVGAANAKVVNIADWEGGMNYRTNEADKPTSCSESCSGYELTTLICPAGQKLIDCEVAGCEYYHRCIDE